MKTETKTEMKTEILTREDLNTLKAPFPRERLGIKVQSLSKDKSRAMLVLYLQHTDVQDRLEEVDPAWTTEVLKEERVGGEVYVRIRMTLKGVARENVGEGSDPKGAYSDALKRCAMLFGVGRYLYDSPTVWADYNDSKDRFRQWTIDDYERAATASSSRVSQARAPAARPALGPEFPAASPPRVSSHAAGAPQAEISLAPTTGRPTGGEEEAKKSRDKKPPRTREQLNRMLMSLYRPYLSRFPETRIMDLLQSRYQVSETRMMTLEQIADLVQYMERQLAQAA